jgi:hypothetical protein
MHVDSRHKLVCWLIGEKLHTGVCGRMAECLFKIGEEISGSLSLIVMVPVWVGSMQDLGSPGFEGVFMTALQGCDNRQRLPLARRHQAGLVVGWWFEAQDADDGGGDVG